MRGEDERSGSLFSYVDLEARVGKDHQLRTIRGVVNEALASLSSEFSALYALMGSGKAVDFRTAQRRGVLNRPVDARPKFRDPIRMACDAALAGRPIPGR